jgi:uncharacterized peroxidase-related enzyme
MKVQKAAAMIGQIRLGGCHESATVSLLLVKAMAWIKTIEPQQAEGELAKLYQAIGSARGGIANVHQISSLNSRAVKAHLEIYKAIVFQRSTLSRIDRERIAVVVSHANDCSYCVAHHGSALRQLGDSEAVVAALSKGQSPDSLGAGERELLAWARRGALSPAECDEANVKALLAAGYDDRAVLDAALTVAYFSFVNRLVLLLGVAEEEDFEEMCRDLQATE